MKSNKQLLKNLLYSNQYKLRNKLYLTNQTLTSTLYEPAQTKCNNTVSSKLYHTTSYIQRQHHHVDNHVGENKRTIETHKCWNCENLLIKSTHTHKLSPILQFCNVCNCLQSHLLVLENNNYYEIFNITDYTYKIDKKMLTDQYKNLQRLLHPDVYALKNSVEKSISSDISSFVNSVYDTLYDDYSRAIYILECNKIVWEKINTGLNNSTELLYVMQKREEIDSCIENKNIDMLNTLYNDNTKLIKKIVNKLNDTLSPHNRNLTLTTQQIDKSLPLVAKFSYLMQIENSIKPHLNAA